MKSKKNEELKSRRDFFKKAAKSVLPVLGAVVLGSSPIVAKASETAMGCSWDCSSSCYGSCQGGCSGCSGGCKGNCEGNCQGSCKGSCQGSCETTCQGSSTSSITPLIYQHVPLYR